MPKLTTQDFVRLSGGRAVGPPAQAEGLVSDSHDVRPGLAFVAIGRGHEFVRLSYKAGASFVVLEREEVIPEGASAVVVDDSVAALAPVAAEVRASMDVPVIAITGSTGKTLTRDLTAAALGARYRVHRSPRNLNTEVGVPVTLFATPDDAEMLVLELGARHAGEIAELAALVRPSMGIVTGIGVAHIEEFGTRDAIARTKSELLTALPPDGVAFVPSNDDYLDVLAASTDARVVTVGPAGAVRYRADGIDDHGRTRGTIWLDDREMAIELPVAGRALVRNAAFALAVAAASGVDPDHAARALAEAELTSSRMHVADVGGRTVIDDAYNANPTSIASALRSAREMAGSGRPLWGVLGPMAELGESTAAEHERAGRLARELGFDGLIVVGEAPEIEIGYGTGALRVGSLAEALGAVLEHVPSDAVVVIKASRMAGLDRLLPLMKASADVGIGNG